MKKHLSLFLASLLLAASLAGCGGKPADDTPETSAPVTDSIADTSAPDTTAPAEESPESIRVYTLKGPTGMGMSKMISDAKAENADSPYEFTISSSPDEVKAEIIKGAYDIAALPTNLAAVLYNKTEGALVVGAVNTLGVLYVLENGDTVQSLADLNGKTLYATGKASTPEYILNYILETNKIDCKVEYLAEHSELASQMAAGTVSLGMLPVPNSTTVLANNKDVRVALNLTEEWTKAAETNKDNSALYQGCIVIRREFAEKYPSAVKAFLSDYKSSVEYVNQNQADAAQLIADCGIVPAAGVALKALPDANIVFVAGEEMKTGLEGFYQVLFKFNPAAVGGKLPDDHFYYIEK